MDNKKNNVLWYIALVCLALVVTYIFLRHRSYFYHINIRRIRHYILSYGKFAAVAFVVVYSLKPIFFIVPASLLSILAGSIFGPWRAFFLSMISCFFAATLAFYLARILGKPFVDKILKGKVMKLDSSIEKHGFMIMFLMRLSFVFPYDALSYAAGLTKMKYKDYILGTMLGILPEMLSYSLMGRHMNNPFSLKFIFPILALVMIAVVSSYLYKDYKNKN